MCVLRQAVLYSLWALPGIEKYFRQKCGLTGRPKRVWCHGDCTGGEKRSLYIKLQRRRDALLTDCGEGAPDRPALLRLASRSHGCQLWLLETRGSGESSLLAKLHQAQTPSLPDSQQDFTASHQRQGRVYSIHGITWHFLTETQTSFSLIYTET